MGNLVKKKKAFTTEAPGSNNTFEMRFIFFCRKNNHVSNTGLKYM